MGLVIDLRLPGRRVRDGRRLGLLCISTLLNPSGFHETGAEPSPRHSCTSAEAFPSLPPSLQSMAKKIFPPLGGFNLTPRESAEPMSSAVWLIRRILDGGKMSPFFTTARVAVRLTVHLEKKPRVILAKARLPPTRSSVRLQHLR